MLTTAPGPEQARTLYEGTSIANISVVCSFIHKILLLSSPQVQAFSWAPQRVPSLLYSPGYSGS